MAVMNGSMSFPGFSSPAAGPEAPLDMLEAMAGSDAVCIRELTEALEEEHRTLENRWARMRTPLQAVAQGQAATLTAQEVEAFVTGYRAHILREDTELLPMAQRLLGTQALLHMGQAMRNRRGL